MAFLHCRVLDMEFLSRFGPNFMSAYYLAWIDAPGAIAVVATDSGGDVLGALLGATDPARHARAMVHQSGVRLALSLAKSAVARPRLAKDLMVTRGQRYARGLSRLLIARISPRKAPASQSTGTKVGEITHVLVRPEDQGRGVGRALMDAARQQAHSSGVNELVLVTPPDLAARTFYERLGWQSEGTMTSRSGERFLRFRLVIGGEGSKGTDSSN
ncbi:MAG TPA: GNAT family N-acetyltransferase [Acidimicrobiales bacterium]|nr:GNAT family N-acetyltransferase [Acidimicrobiales bacterium]